MRESTPEEFETFLSEHKPLPTPATFRDGELLGNWRITAFIDKGGSGEVYCAEHVKDSRSAALKVHVRRPGKSDSQENSARERFEREARILYGNSYSFFPKLYEFGEARGYLYFAIELLEPISLPDTDAAIASFMLELCRAVRVLHGNGLVHRDIKPQNIMRRSSGELVLIDLGLVKEFSAGTSSSGMSVTLVDGKAVGVGTPRYAAPEQFNGGAVSPATDIHALGMLANECFGGRPPHAWERIISRSTSSIPERRYADVGAFARAIRHRRNGRIIACCGAALAMIAAVAFAMFGGRDIPRVPSSPSWRTIATDITTNGMRETVISLNNQRRSFAAPMLLESNWVYRVVGPGTLDVSLDGKPGSKLYLDNCVLLNRTTNAIAKCGVRYVFCKGSYLNFINQERDDNYGYRVYMEDFDGAFNALEFKGPETIKELLKRRNDEMRRLMEREYMEK